MRLVPGHWGDHGCSTWATWDVHTIYKQNWAGSDRTPAHMLLHWALFLFFLKGASLLTDTQNPCPLRPSLQNSIPNVRRAQLPLVKGLCVWSAQLQCLSLFLCGTKPVSCPWRYPGCRRHLSSLRLQVPAYFPNRKLPKPQRCCIQGRRQKASPPCAFLSGWQ